VIVRSLAALLVLAAIAVACLPPTTRGSAGQPSANGIATASPSAAITPRPTRPLSFVPPTPTPAPTFAVHTVVAGDNLNIIARKFGTSARSIAFWNRATYPTLDPESAGYRPDLLKVGWTLFVIPNLILTDDEAPPLPSAGAGEEPSPS
jgi:nucleoid-associated protein YgaU